jgi:hypothetical protein
MSTIQASPASNPDVPAEPMISGIPALMARGHHNLGVALDRRRGEHASAGGKWAGAGIGAAGIATDHPGAERNRLIERFREKAFGIIKKVARSRWRMR